MSDASGWRQVVRATEELPPLPHHRRLTAGIGMAAKPAAMVARGAALRVRVGHAGGPLLVGRGVRVRGAALITTRGRLSIEDGAELQAISRRGLSFGSGVSIGAMTMIRPSSYYGGPLGEGLVMGDRSSIGPWGYIGCSGLVTIGDDVMFGPGVHVYAENHDFDDLGSTIKSQGVTRAPVTIEDDCWIASGVTVTAGVTIGRGSVVAAGSVVTKNVPPMSVAAGVPARVLRTRDAR